MVPLYFFIVSSLFLLYMKKYKRLCKAIGITILFYLGQQLLMLSSIEVVQFCFDVIHDDCSIDANIYCGAYLDVWLSTIWGNFCFTEYSCTKSVHYSVKYYVTIYTNILSRITIYQWIDASAWDFVLKRKVS